MAEVLSEGPVERIAFDFGVEFLTGDGATVRAEGDAELVADGGVARAFDAESPAGVASVLLEFLHRPARVLLEGASLVMRSTDPILELRVEPSMEFEAWSVTAADGSRVVCSPGGEVTRWSGS